MSYKTSYKNTTLKLTKEKRIKAEKCNIFGNNCRISGNNNVIFTNGSIIIGDENKIRGNKNIIRGSNNHVRGKNNKIKQESKQPPREEVISNILFENYIGLIMHTMNNDQSKMSELKEINTLEDMKKTYIKNIPDYISGEEGEKELLKSEEDRKTECSICYTKGRKELTFFPCGHRGVCYECFKNICKGKHFHDSKIKCPNCRKKIEQAVITF